MKTLHIALFFLGLLLPSIGFGQTDDRSRGVAFFQRGSYKEAAALLEKAVKAAPTDIEAQNFLALAQMRLGRLKDAEETLITALTATPNDLAARKSLAFVYLVRGKFYDAISEIRTLGKHAPLDAEAFYIYGLAKFRIGSNHDAIESANEAIRLNEKYAAAYLLKAQAIMDLWNGEPENYREVNARFGNPMDSLGKYMMLAADSSEAPFWREQQESLKVFAKYFEEREKDKTLAGENIPTTPIKVIKRPRPIFSNRARDARIGGKVKLLVAFGANGKVEHVLVLSSPGYGLDEVSVRAAKKIEFEPATRNGQPVLIVRTLDYVFIP